MAGEGRKKAEQRRKGGASSAPISGENCDRSPFVVCNRCNVRDLRINVASMCLLARVTRCACHPVRLDIVTSRR